MTKIEKLKEVNIQVDTIVKQLEARMFIENVEDVQNKRKIEEKPKVHVDLIQQV